MLITGGIQTFLISTTCVISDDSKENKKHKGKHKEKGGRKSRMGMYCIQCQKYPRKYCIIKHCMPKEVWNIRTQDFWVVSRILIFLPCVDFHFRVFVIIDIQFSCSDTCFIETNIQSMPILYEASSKYVY